ncbi:hypothetical protein COHA_007520 [Chlorella ohadii]|uniref:Uncharacterized protein n=1 Tax=Chlorella ohadii TaxID=2649997 RepID=A0AAD5DQQ3_9CHLO|nr:hypothetical protein COHA_007520 [Chlorella ohadii]
MLRTASRRLSVLQPSQPPELPLAAQGGSSLLLLATLLHWSSAAGAAADEQQQQTAEVLRRAVRSLLPETAVVQYLQDRLGLDALEADAVLERIQTLGPPESQCYRRRQPREVSLAEVMPVVDFLSEEIVGLDVAALVRRHPHILVDTSVERLRHNCQQLAEELQLTPQQLARIARKCPFLLRADLPRNMLPICELLRGWGLLHADVRRVVVSHPSFFMYRPETIEERIRWLHEELGLSKKDVATLLRKYVLVAAYSAAQHEHGRRWLLEQGVPSSKLPRAITRFPHLLIYSGNKRSEWVGFMRDELGLSQAAVARVLVSQPDMTGRSLALLRKHLGMWQTVLRLSPAQLKSMLEANAAVLRLDVSSPTYAAKIEYLKHLLERIVVRGEYLRAVGRLVAESPTGWLASSEPLFASKFAKTNAAEFAAFKLRFLASPEARQLLGSAEQERAQRMTGRRLEHERAADAASLAEVERSLRQRIKQPQQKAAVEGAA